MTVRDSRSSTRRVPCAGAGGFRPRPRRRPGGLTRSTSAYRSRSWKPLPSTIQPVGPLFFKWPPSAAIASRASSAVGFMGSTTRVNIARNTFNCMAERTHRYQLPLTLTAPSGMRRPSRDRRLHRERHGGAAHSRAPGSRFHCSSPDSGTRTPPTLFKVPLSRHHSWVVFSFYPHLVSAVRSPSWRGEGEAADCAA